MTVRPTKLSAPPSGPAGGDLSGNFPNPTVLSLEGYPIEAPPPINGDTLTFNSILEIWEHNPPISTGGNPIGPAGGDLSGSYPNPSVAKLLSYSISSSAPSNGDTFIWDGTAWTPTAPNRSPTGSAGGDLSGTYPNPSVAKINGNAVSSSSPSTGNSLVWNGTSWAPATATALPKFGGILSVDAVNGNDATGTVNGSPFLTISAAITYINTNSLTGVTVWIFPGTYNLTSNLTIPDTCSIRGVSLQTCKLQRTATANATMIVMGENTRLEDLSITLTSSTSGVNLVGISAPGTTSVTSKVRTCVITVDNSSVGTGTTSNVFGIVSSGTGTINEASFSFNFIKGSTVNVKSNGAGSKRGIIQNAENQMSTRDTNIYVASPTDLASTGSYIGVETTNSSGRIEFRSSSIGGPTSSGSFIKSDILQTNPASYGTNGIQIGPGTDLVTKSAGGKPFTTYVYPKTLIYGINGTPTVNSTRYWWPGTLTTGGDATEVFYRFQQASIIQGMSVNMRTAPGVGKSIQFTVKKSSTGVAGSGVATAMTLTVSDANKLGYKQDASVDIGSGEFISLEVVNSNGSAAADVVCEIDVF